MPGGKVINRTSSGGQLSANMNILEMKISGDSTLPTSFINYGNIYAVNCNPGNHIVWLQSTKFENHGLLAFSDEIQLVKSAQLVSYGTVDGSGTGVISSSIDVALRVATGDNSGALPAFYNKGGTIKG